MKFKEITIGDTVTDAVHTWSSNKIAQELALKSSATAISGLSDVDSTAKATGKTLQWNGTTHVYVTPAAGGAAIDDASPNSTTTVFSASKTTSLLNAKTLSGLADIDPAAKADLKMLQWNATAAKHVYVPAPVGGATAMSGLTDVDSTAKADLKILQYNAAAGKHVYVPAPVGSSLTKVSGDLNSIAANGGTATFGCPSSSLITTSLITGTAPPPNYSTDMTKASASGSYGTTLPKNAFDGKALGTLTGTNWQSLNSGNASNNIDWIAYDAVSPVILSKFDIGSRYSTATKIWYSDDATTWTYAEQITISDGGTGDTGKTLVGTYTAHRYWAFRPVTLSTGYNWIIYYIRMYAGANVITFRSINPANDLISYSHDGANQMTVTNSHATLVQSVRVQALY